MCFVLDVAAKRQVVVGHASLGDQLDGAEIPPPSSRQFTPGEGCHGSRLVAEWLTEWSRGESQAGHVRQRAHELSAATSASSVQKKKIGKQTAQVIASLIQAPWQCYTSLGTKVKERIEHKTKRGTSTSKVLGNKETASGTETRWRSW